jgi:predicted acetyltransferase
MNIESIDAAIEHKPVLGNLMELYQYDFTQFSPEDIGDDGRYGFDRLDSYWEEANRHPHLLRIDGKWAGLALVRENVEFLDGRTGIDMTEFFVMRRYRRGGAGERLATTMFDRYRGLWQVRELRANEPAQAFWRAIIGRYTGGAYEERNWDDERQRGPAQYFDSSAV